MWTPEKEREYQRTYRAKHREHLIARGRERYQAKKSYYAEYNKEYRKTHRKEIYQRQKRWRLENKTHCNTVKQKWRGEHIERLRGVETKYRNRNRTRIFAYRLEWEFNLTLEQYQTIERQQKGRCAICRKKPEPIKGKSRCLYVDHCHKSGRIRGLLCHACNFGLGFFRDSPKLMLRAIEYAKRRRDLREVKTG